MRRVLLRIGLAAIGVWAANAVHAQASAPEPAVGSTSAAASGPVMTPSQRRAWERNHRMSRLLGAEVRNRSGQKIGDLRDLVVDSQGKVTLAIVSTGGFLGLNDRLHAVPWEALRSASDGTRVLDMERAQLSRVPGFSDDAWPDLGNEQWAQENRRHFGL
jgi:sporulation protein YlmC with PRC-barrel domain